MGNKCKTICHLRITQFDHLFYNVNSWQRFQSLCQLLGHHLITAILDICHADQGHRVITLFENLVITQGAELQCYLNEGKS